MIEGQSKVAGERLPPIEPASGACSLEPTPGARSWSECLEGDINDKDPYTNLEVMIKIPLVQSMFLCFILMFNSSFYMLLLTYIHQYIKNIYIIKNAPGSGAFENGTPALAPAPRFRSRSQVTLLENT